MKFQSRFLRACLVMLSSIFLTACQDQDYTPRLTENASLPKPTTTVPHSPIRITSATHHPPPSLRFERISTEDGLSHSSVTCILQDHLGFMWFGTQNGLNRYDGYNFIVYRRDPGDPNALQDDFIESLYEDKDGVLWVGTQSGWLSRYDREQNRFTNFEIGPHIFAILEDNHGYFWLGTLDPGLVRFNRETGETTVVWSGREFRSIKQDYDGTIWAASLVEGLGKYDQENDMFTQYSVEYPVYQTLVDDEGSLWLATLGGGLGHLDPTSGTVTYYRHNASDLNSLSGDYVSAVYQDKSGILWISTNQKGIDRFDPNNSNFNHYSHNPGNFHSLSESEVVSIYQDRTGGIWFGHDVGGSLSKLVAGSEAWGHYSHDPGQPNGISGNLVTSITEDKEGVLWFGTDNGLDRWDRATGLWQNYHHDPDDESSLSNNMVQSVFVDALGNLWVGTEGDLESYNRVDNQFIHYDMPVVMWMHEGPSGSFWLATKKGLYQYNRETDQFIFINKGFSWKIMVYEDHTGMVWVGSSGDGLDLFNPQTNTWTHFEYDPDDPASLSNNFIESIHEDANGVMWLATGGGLNRFDRGTGTFLHYTERQGLSHDNVFGILEDDGGHLWLATGGGMSKFDPKTETFKNYFVRDGLQSNLFWRNAYYRNPSGEMFFGGENGFNVFHPDRIAKNSTQPPIIITKFSIFNIITRSTLPPDEKISLSYKENFLSFDFVALDFNNPNKNQYAYRMDGVDGDWVFAGTRRHADYPNLRPGTYTFRVKGSNNDGVWNEQGTAITITIKPPWWGTWGFRIAVIILAFVAVIGTYMYRLQSLEARRRALEREVKVRTSELQESNKQLAQVIIEREKIEESLAQQRAEKAVAEERNRLARELHDAVTQTLFSASLLAEALPTAWERNPEEGKMLLEDVRQLSRGALAEMRTLLHELRPSTLVETPLPDLLQQLAVAAAGRESITIDVSVECSCSLPSDVHLAFYRIAQETLNNVIKHARAQNVTIHLHCTQCADGKVNTQQPNQVILTIQDDGRGFNVKHAYAEGMGLIFMRERADAINAVLKVESEPEKGTHIILTWTDTEV